MVCCFGEKEAEWAALLVAASFSCDSSASASRQLDTSKKQLARVHGVRVVNVSVDMRAQDLQTRPARALLSTRDFHLCPCSTLTCSSTLRALLSSLHLTLYSTLLHGPTVCQNGEVATSWN